ncbi:FAD-binding oxidoreductase [Bradyrhizobium sp. 31Argb]|uniref:FAD-binding oxidoreductase n=1 Tax=unclassified Bradyrhizobium TaxID=2631580 RepID=UPI00249F619A|nr:FAD-binding oxidoreductase [Bradyrhizobium sp. Arg237L]MDI4236247.1 FAD-binding oxidoreductase [Bradyrhizobium sp. Arg237L]
MSATIDAACCGLSEDLLGLVSLPGDDRYAAATSIWAKQVGVTPGAVVHCRTARDVQDAIRAAREREVPLSVRGGGHDWAGRALCEGAVIDLSGMRNVVLSADRRSATIAGGARAGDVVAVTDPYGLAVVAGSVSSVGIAGLTLGGGYGPLIGRFGLAIDNMLAAEIVLADGRIVHADTETNADLFWALCGGGGNFGVVTAMRHRVHELPSVHSGMLVYPFSEARAVLERCSALMASAPEELTVQHTLMADPSGTMMVLIVPTWSGRPEDGEARLQPFARLGTLLAGSTERKSYAALLGMFDPYIANGLQTVMDSCWLPALDRDAIDAFIHAMESAVSPGCAIITHEFRGAASRVAETATAFGLRRDHVLVEILASFPDRSDASDVPRHRHWTRGTRERFASALPGGYPNFLGKNELDRARQSYGGNAGRLMEIKHRYDPDNVFSSAIPLPRSV